MIALPDRGSHLRRARSWRQLGYRLVAAATSGRAAHGVLLLVLGAVLTLWVLSNLTFDAGL